MELLDSFKVKKIIQEINDHSEVARRAESKRKHDIYKDDAQKFLIDKILNEFGSEALPEMRLAPVNVFRKIVNKKSAVYKKSPIRKAELESDQVLMDFYSVKLCLDKIMQKANRYYNAAANTAIYCVPWQDGLKIMVVPSYLYSVVPSEWDPCLFDAYFFNSFKEGSVSVTPTLVQPQAAGEGFNFAPGSKSNGDLVASNEKDSDTNRKYIVWTDKEHFTATSTGERIYLDPSKGDEQFVNPIGMKPVVNVAKDRDDESWSKIGNDLADQCLGFAVGWTDLLTITKHQGYSHLLIIAKNKPEKMTFGINRATYLKQGDEGEKDPSLSYVSSGAPIGEYRASLADYLGIILTSNDMKPGSVSGEATPENAASGFSQMISMADVLEVVEADKPVFRDAELELWEIVKRWHNWMFDNNLIMNPETKALGKFSEGFKPSIIYQDVRPLESEQERLNNVKLKIELGLASKRDAMKALHPDLTEAQVDAKLKEIEEEKHEAMEALNAAMTTKTDQETSESEPSDEDLKSLLSKWKEQVKETEQNLPGNPASWVANEELWEKAKRASKKALGSIKYPFVVWLYENWGGEHKQG